MLNVGLTGGVASGKSETLALFKKFGAATLSSDAIVRDLMKPGSPAVRKIRTHFGPAAVEKSGKVCREYLRERVMADPKELDWLERVLHPGVRRSIRAAIAENRKKSGVLVVEVPLLFENGFAKLFDRTVAVKALSELAERRAARRNMSPELFYFFSKRQWSAAKKAASADLVINNNGTLKDLERGAHDAYKKLVSGKRFE